MTNPTNDLDEILSAFANHVWSSGLNHSGYEWRETHKAILAWHNQRLQEAMDSIGEPLLTDFDTPTPEEYQQMLKVVRWYKKRLAKLKKGNI